MIVIYLRVKWAHSGRMLRLLPGTSCSKGLIWCLGVWEMLLLPVCSPFGVKVELFSLYMSRSLKRWHSKAAISLIVRHNTWPVLGLNSEHMLIQFNNLLVTNEIGCPEATFPLLLMVLWFVSCLCGYFKTQRLFGVPNFFMKMWFILFSWW